MPEADNIVVLPSPVVKPRAKPWRVLRVERDGNDGLCRHSDKVIELDPSLEGRALFDTALHEAAHAALPDLDEDAVERLIECQLALLGHLGLAPEEEE